MKFLFSLLAVLAHALQPCIAADNTPAPQVVFICDHGSAKSMIAASYFNQMASERGLPYRAVSRGITPDAALQPATEKGLRQDGITTDGLSPTAVTQDMVAAATRVVTITVEHTPGYILARDTLETWNDIPAVSKDYGAARDAMVRRIDALLSSLATAANP